MFDSGYMSGWVMSGTWGASHWLIFCPHGGCDCIPCRAYPEAARVFAALVNAGPCAGRQPDRVMGCGVGCQF